MSAMRWARKTSPIGFHSQFTRCLDTLVAILVPNSRSFSFPLRVIAEKLRHLDSERINAIVNLCSATINLGAGLSYSKEWRDIFEDLQERVAVPLAELRWQPLEFGAVLQHIAASANSLGLAEDVKATFRRAFPR